MRQLRSGRGHECHGREHLVLAARERCEHRQAVGPVARLAEAQAIQHHRRVRSQHRQILAALPDGFGLGAGHAFHIRRDGFAGLHRLIDVGHRDRMRHADLCQKLLPSGGCRSQSQHGNHDSNSLSRDGTDVH